MGDSSRDTLGRIIRLALVAVVVVLAATGPVAAHAGDDGAHHHDGVMGSHGGMGWGMGWGAWLLWPALLLGGVAAYALLVRARADSSDDALSALREQYARGDIDDEEFERRRQTLQRSRR